MFIQNLMKSAKPDERRRVILSVDRGPLTHNHTHTHTLSPTNTCTLRHTHTRVASFKKIKGEIWPYAVSKKDKSIEEQKKAKFTKKIC